LAFWPSEKNFLKREHLVFEFFFQMFKIIIKKTKNKRERQLRKVSRDIWYQSSQFLYPERYFQGVQWRHRN